MGGTTPGLAAKNRAVSVARKQWRLLTLKRIHQVCKYWLLFIVLCGAQIAQAAVTNGFVLDWGNRFTQAATHYTICAATPGSNLCVILAGSSVGSQITTNGELFLWKMGVDGNVTTQLRLNLPERPQSLIPLVRRYVRDILELKGGGMLLITEITEGSPAIVRLSAGGDVVLNASIPAIAGLPAELLASRLVATTDGNFVILGEFRRSAVLLKMDRDGNLLWQRKLEGPNRQFFVDAVPTEGGGLVAVANSGTYNKYGFGISDVWVAAFDADGKETRRTRFAGRQGSICRGQNGNVAVVFDKTMGTGQDIWMRLLDADLKPLWAKAVVSVQRGFSSPFRVVSAPGSGFMVAGLRDFTMWISKRDKDGEGVWSHSEPGPPSSWQLSSLIRIDNEYIVLYSTRTVDTEPELYQIGALGFHEGAGTH